MTRRSAIAGAMALIATDQMRSVKSAIAGTNAPALMAGVNLAGAEFGNIPGTLGTEYMYPTRSNVDYYRGLGFSLVRVPFKWERLQPHLGGEFVASEIEALADIVSYASGAGLHVILDPHNYAKRRIPDDGWAREYLIGSTAVPTRDFTSFWAQLAERFRDDKRVIFGLMNEPTGPTPAAWLDVVNRTIAMIRSRNADNLILVPGVAYTGAHSWFSAGNTALAGTVDPANHFAFDVHQYFDADSSGTRPDAVSGNIGSERIEQFQWWAREQGVTAFLGEFCGGRNAASYNALHDICQEMSAHPDVWIGWAAWAGGPRWPEADMFNLEPWSDGRIREQTAILANYANPKSAHFWVWSGAALDLDFARNRSFGVPTFESAIAVMNDNAPADRAQCGAVAHPLPLSNKGLAIGQAESGLPMLACGPLRELTRRPALTLMVETRELSTKGATRPILGIDGVSLLGLTLDGSLVSEWAQMPRTVTQPAKNWQMKRKIALTIDHQRRRVAIAATGTRAVVGSSGSAELDRLAIGGSPNAGGGYVTRITGYEHAMTPDALETLVA